MKRIVHLIAFLLAVSVWGVAPQVFACNGGPDAFVTNVSRTFSAGSTWSVDIYRSPCEGLVLRGASFTPFGGSSTIVLHRASIAEVHVPYDNNIVRFLDVTSSTSGLGVNAIPLFAAECGGSLFDGNRVCVQNEDGGAGWKFSSSFRTKERVEIFMASQLGNYTYINSWTFHDDGAIEPEVGLTGQLQITSTAAADVDFGTRLNPQASSPAVYGLNHMHNFYYRLDFDINGAGSDRVSRISYSPFIAPGACANSGACGKTLYTNINTETSQTWSTTGQTSWAIFDTATLNADGRNIGYELRPHLTGLWRGMLTAGEPWSNAELWVTAYNGCELLAVNNMAPYLDPGLGCVAPAANVSTMLNAQNVNSADLVVWYANRLHHVTRDEDQTMMPRVWTGFHIEHRSFSASYPAP
jgi:primary-amine oxidase